MRAFIAAALLVGWMFVPAVSGWPAASAQPFASCATNPENATLLFPAGIPSALGRAGESLDAGDILAVMNSRGACLGMSAWTRRGAVLAAAGTLRDGDLGYDPGDAIQVVVWDASAQALYKVEQITFGACKGALPCSEEGLYVPGRVLTVTSIRATASWEGPVHLQSVAGPDEIVLEWRLDEDAAATGAKADAMYEVALEHRTPSAAEWERWQLIDARQGPQETLRIPRRELGVGMHQFRITVQHASEAWTSAVRSVTIDQPRTPMVSAPHPNPAAGCAQLEVWVPEERPVRVSVYNTLGQRVQRLYEGRLPARKGRTFRLCTGPLAAGLYFVRVSSAEFSATRRVVLVR